MQWALHQIKRRVELDARRPGNWTCHRKPNATPGGAWLGIGWPSRRTLDSRLMSGCGQRRLERTGRLIRSLAVPTWLISLTLQRRTCAPPRSDRAPRSIVSIRKSFLGLPATYVLLSFGCANLFIGQMKGGAARHFQAVRRFRHSVHAIHEGP